jgi:hypothetical protein
MSRRGIDTALVAASLLLYSFVVAPAPALNEPHYLGKAKHFWQPQWCAGDFFLESVDAHTVFFATVGALTTVCSLEATAIIGRVLALGLVAWGWTALAHSLTRSLTGTNMPGCVAIWLFLALATIGNWSGEWLVGGVEGKVFAYGCLFLAWSQAIKARWRRSALALGAAIAFHPVVGLWGLLALLGALACSWFSRDPQGSALACPASWLTGALIVIVVALPGLIPVVRIMLEPVDPLTRYAGTYIQVYYRLAHHLDPMQFPGRAHAGYAALAAVWLIGWRFGPRDRAWAWLHQLTAWSLAFALVGLVIGWGPRPPQEMPGYEWRMHLLKFYPFRLADVLLPAAVSLIATAGLLRFTNRLVQLVCVVLLAFAALFPGHHLVRFHKNRPPSASWRDVCQWARQHTPREALFITPYGQWTFKWYAERPEFTNRKDCPQDVRGIVEWNRRQLLLTKWYDERFADGRYSRDELDELRRLTNADYLIFEKAAPIDAAPVYQNATHRVYDLRESHQTE